MLHSDQSAIQRHLVDRYDYSELREDGDKTAVGFESFGIPTVYHEQKVKIITGQTIRDFSDEWIQQALSQGVFLDVVAAEILLERGFGKLIGVNSISQIKEVTGYGVTVSAEEFHNREFGGDELRYMSALLPDYGYCSAQIGVIDKLNEAKEISAIVDVDCHRIMTGMLAFDNVLGGRVVVCAWNFESAMGINFCTHTRRIMMQNVIQYLSFGTPELLVRGGVYPYALRKDLDDGRTFLGLHVFNLATWPTAEFAMGNITRPVLVKTLTSSGKWVEFDDWSWQGDDLFGQLTIKREVQFNTPLYLLIQ